MGEWLLEWSQCDPHQCWIGLRQLWVLEGINDQFLGLPNSLSVVDHREDCRELPAQGADWAQYGN